MFGGEIRGFLESHYRNLNMSIQNVVGEVEKRIISQLSLRIQQEVLKTHES